MSQSIRSIETFIASHFPPFSRTIPTICVPFVVLILFTLYCPIFPFLCRIRSGGRGWLYLVPLGILCCKRSVIFCRLHPTLCTGHCWYYIVMEIGIIVARPVLFVSAMFAHIDCTKIPTILACNFFDLHISHPSRFPALLISGLSSLSVP